MTWDLTDSHGHRIGRVDNDGRITDDRGRRVGSVDSDGRIRNEYGRTIGWRNSDGRLTDERGVTTGFINSDGRITNKYGQTESHFSENNSGCYLTSACVAYKELPDDCELLSKLRSFRDSYMQASEERSLDVEHYYAMAPTVVAYINHLPSSERSNVYEKIYNTILRCVESIDSGHPDRAYSEYKKMALSLERIVC